MNEWVSASAYAKAHGVSTQTVYNMVKQGLLETMTFVRGSRKGILIHQ